MKDTALAPQPESTRIWDLEAQREWNVLVVSTQTENRKVLLHALDRLPVSTYLARTIEQAQEVLASRPIEVIFCEEFLPDGSYRQLLETSVAKRKATRFVVTFHTGEWDEYLEAMRLGVTDVLRCPLQSVDVELVLIRASHDKVTRRFEEPGTGHAIAHALKNSGQTILP